LVDWPKEVKDATLATPQLRDPRHRHPQQLQARLPVRDSQVGRRAGLDHKLNGAASKVTRYNNQMIVQPDGRYQLTKLTEDVQSSTPR